MRASVVTLAFIIGALAMQPHAETPLRLGSPAAQSVQKRGDDTMPISGIQGQVSFGPIGPIARRGLPNYRPMQAKLTVLNAEGRVVAQLETDAKGIFRLELEPGAYTLHPEPSGGRTRAADRRITVLPGELTKIGINYDSGIR